MRCRVLLRLAVVLAVTTSAALLRAQQPAVGSATVVPIQVTGDPTKRFSMVVLGDGYTAADMPKFRDHLDKHLNILWSIEPFRSYRNYINVYAVEIVSGESGITCDPEIRERRNTPLGMEFGGGCTNINARGITIPQEKQEITRKYAAMATPHFDQILVIANTDSYGGIGGRLATTSGGNSLGPLITPHELGHSLGGLTDEYTYSARGKPGGAFTGGEPGSIHMTTLSIEDMLTKQAKWYRWLGEPSESGGKIERFEGGSQRTTGVWRPSKHSMMISVGYYFDQVSRERMTQRISQQLELIAASTPTGAPVGRTDVLWIETAHPVYHELTTTWQLDGKTVATNSPYFDLGGMTLGTDERQDRHGHGERSDDIRPRSGDSQSRADGDQIVDNRPGGEHTAAQQARRDHGIDADRASDRRQGHRVRDDVALFRGHLSADVEAERPDGRNGSQRPNLFRGRADAAARPSYARGHGDGPDAAAAQLDRRRAQRAAVPERDQHASVDDRQHRADGDGDALARGGVVHLRRRRDALLHARRVHDEAGTSRRPAGLRRRRVPRQRRRLASLLRLARRAAGHAVQVHAARDDDQGTGVRQPVIRGALAAAVGAARAGLGHTSRRYRGIDAAGNIGTATAFRVTFVPAPACTVTIAAPHKGALRIESGVTCVNDTTMEGPVTVAAGASLVAQNATFTGGITATGAEMIEIAGGSVQGAVRVTNTTGRVTIFGATLADVAITGSKTAKPALLTGNTIRGALACTGNATAPEHGGSPNTVAKSATGQCAGK